MLEKFKSKIVTIKEFIGFLWERKLWWLIPMILLLLVIGLVLVISHGTVFAPFIYVLF